MVKILIRVDWLNNRVELSPNLKVLKNELNNERTVLTMEINYNPNMKEYPVYKYATNEMGKEDVFDDDPDSFWWKANMDITPDGAKGAITSAPMSASIAASSPASTPKPASAPASAPASTPKPASAPATVIEQETECRPSPDEIARLKSQLKQIQNIFLNLQQQAMQGKVSEKDFLEKQTFLGEKMGKIMAELDKWHEPYE